MSDAHETWNQYYAAGEMDTHIRDKNYFAMEVSAIVGAVAGELGRTPRTSLDVLELGAATGFLAQAVVEAARSCGVLAVSYTGVDFSEVAVAQARARGLPGCSFVVGDFLEHMASDGASYDLVVTQRSIMAVLDRESQRRLLRLIASRMRAGAFGVFSEGTRQGLDHINALRAELGIEPFHRIWHSFHVDEGDVHDVFSEVEINDFASTYWLVTRAIYPYFQEPVHNTPLHAFAARLPQEGNHGLVKLFVVRP